MNGFAAAVEPTSTTMVPSTNPICRAILTTALPVDAYRAGRLAVAAANSDGKASPTPTNRFYRTTDERDDALRGTFGSFLAEPELIANHVARFL
jgi:hypothetical protein